MKLTTEIPISPSEHQIGVSDKLLLVGSCFAQEMGQWFLQRRFDVHLNPNGILFHPMVMARCLRRAMHKINYEVSEWIVHDGLYHSFDHHGCWSNVSGNYLRDCVNEQVARTAYSLANASTLVLTWGSAWGYKWVVNGRWVANCHKIPQTNFTKELITADEIVEEHQELFNELLTINPSLRIIISVSPVRYWRDGAHGNQVSKSHLILAASQLAETNAQVHYFPAYEIMMDELRDYRFYNPDMLHPTPQAVEIIIGKFREMFFSEAANNYVKEADPIRKFLEHRPLHTQDVEWREICSQKEHELNRIRRSYA